MNADRWQRAKEIYHSVIEREPRQRGAFLAEACAGDESLRREVESLLACRPEAENLMASPALDVAARELAREHAAAPEIDFTGRTLAHYRIIDKIGAGGMGVVYRARDTHLDRFVAVKVLSLDKVADVERKRRFVLEAKAASALNHPNIITIHDISESGGVTFITMECVEGKTLNAHIPRDGLRLNDTLQYAIQIADALARAHDAGIVHRDMKPSNIMVTGDSLVKVLDFGLAKLTEVPGANLTASEKSTEKTQEGMIVGTVSYMSPEQAEGTPVDSRSDIFSFGAVLYEMATGRRAFQGDCRNATLSDILHKEPKPVGKVAGGVPRELDRIIRRCLKKDPARRFQKMSDVKAALEGLQKERAVQSLSAGTPKSGSRRRWMLLAAALAPLAAASVFFIPQITRSWLGKSSSDWESAAFTHLTHDPGIEWFTSLSPDGELVTYAAGGDIHLLRVGETKSVNLTGDSPAVDTQPAFSPDGRLIAFRSERDGGGIFVMSANGESARPITDFGFHPSWSPDGQEIVLGIENIVTPLAGSTEAPAWAVNVATGNKRQLGNGDAAQPTWSPHNLRIAFWTHNGAAQQPAQRDVWTMRTDGTDRIPVTNDTAIDWDPVWSPDGMYLYFASDRGGSQNIWRAPIDERSGRVQGPLEAVTKGGYANQAFMAISRDAKRIVYAETLYSSTIHKVTFDPVAAKVTGLPVALTQGSMMESSLAVSPDGSMLAFNSVRPQWDIWVMQTDGSRRRQLTKDAYDDRSPRWSPDGKEILFMSNRSDRHYEAWAIQPDGSGLRRVTESKEGAFWPIWSSDGLRIIFGLHSPSGAVWSVDPKQAPKDQIPIRVRDSPMYVTSWSTDGRDRLAGQDWPKPGILVYSLPERRTQRLTEFGMFPEWLNDNRRLLFRGGSIPGDANLYIFDTQSGKYHVILTAPPGFMFHDGIPISPDNRTIYYPLLAIEADLWLLSRR